MKKFNHSRLRDDRGSVFIFVAIGIPVLIAILAVVVDVGNWFVHKRVVQNQVDAAALAGSQLWASCFSPSPSPQPMYDEAAKYDGLGAYNPFFPLSKDSVKGPLKVSFNSSVYPPEDDGIAPDDTPASPCTPSGDQRYFFDVKATNSNVLPLFGGLLSNISGPDIHATARTELRQVKSLSGLLPIGVLDPSPRWMYAQFVDEDNGDAALTAWLPLCHGGTTGCSAPSAAGGSEAWATPSTTAVTIPSRDVGVRLKYVWGGTNPDPACGTVLVDCFDNVPSATTSNGLVHIRGWQTGQSAPLAKNVWLLPGTCTDGYFAAAPCSAGIQAEVDLGDAHPVTGAGVTAQVLASVDGSGSFPLSLPSSPPSTGTVTWTLGSGLPLNGTGPHNVTLSWSWAKTGDANCPARKPCKGTFDSGNPVQRSFVADDAARSGPVEDVQIWSDFVSSGANSFPIGSTQNLGVLVSNPCFETEITNPNCPLVILRASTKATGSESESLDCDPNKPTVKEEIATGCGAEYTTFPQSPNETSCPTQSNLWANASPPAVWDCVAVQTGNGDLEGGLQERIGTNPATCANNWPNFPADDRRQVPLFLAPYTAFGNPGSNRTFPVIGFGAFYITGYSGDPCPNATPGLSHGSIAGYFITYISDSNAKPSSNPCDPASLTPCVPVLVK